MAIAINYKSSDSGLKMGPPTSAGDGRIRMNKGEGLRMWTHINIPNMTVTLSECFKLKINLPFTAARTAEWLDGR